MSAIPGRWGGWAARRRLDARVQVSRAGNGKLDHLAVINSPSP
jgi:hypothetical protein